MRSAGAVLLAALLAAAEVPADLITDADRTRFLAALKAPEASSADNTAAELAFFAAEASAALGGSVRNVCKKITKLGPKMSLADLYVASKAGCTFELSKKQKKTLQNALDSGIIVDAYKAVAVATKTKIEVNYSTLKKKLSALRQSDGTFKASEKSSRSDAASTAFAFKLSSAVGTPEKASSTLTAILKQGKSVDRGLYFTSPGRNRIVTTAMILETIVEIDGIEPAKLNAIAKFLTSAKHVRYTEDIYYLSRALNILSNNKVSVPLVITIEEGKIKVTDVMGKPQKAKVEVTKTTKLGKKEEVIKGVTVEKDGSLKSLGTGTYQIELLVKADKFEETATRKVYVPVKVAPKTAVMYVGSSAKLSGNEQKLQAKYPGSFEEQITTSESNYMLLFKMSLDSDIRPEQVFLAFTHEDTGKTAVFVLNVSGKFFNLKLNTGSSDFTDSTFGPGMYSLSVFVGGTLLEASTIWNLGKVDITWPPSLPKSGGLEELKAKPEIKHIFPPPPRVPNFLISVVFTVICLAPLGILILGVDMLGISIKFPSGAQGIWALGFQGSLVAIVALNLAYFIFLNTFQALGFLLILSIPAIISGTKALNFLNASRHKSKSS